MWGNVIPYQPTVGEIKKTEFGICNKIPSMDFKVFSLSVSETLYSTSLYSILNWCERVALEYVS